MDVGTAEKEEIVKGQVIWDSNNEDDILVGAIFRVGNRKEAEEVGDASKLRRGKIISGGVAVRNQLRAVRRRDGGGRGGGGYGHGGGNPKE